MVTEYNEFTIFEITQKAAKLGYNKQAVPFSPSIMAHIFQNHYLMQGGINYIEFQFPFRSRMMKW